MGFDRRQNREVTMTTLAVRDTRRSSELHRSDPNAEALPSREPCGTSRPQPVRAGVPGR